MAAADISSDQLARLCKNCTCLQLRSTALDAILPRIPSAGERDQEHEVDLNWNATDFQTNFLCEDESECDCCDFLGYVVSWWDIRQDLMDAILAKHVLLSLHFVFRLDETVGYGLKALRIRARPDGEAMYIDCPITAATGRDLGTSLRLQPPLSHVNEKTVSWMKSKLESCILHNHFNPDKAFIPDRLLDVGENRLRLVLTKDFQPRDADSHRYIALTYCWGPEPHASKQLKTTSGNMSQHQQQIPELSLPQALRDAVTVTRALSIQYLWVDALCIIQDNVSDWEKQCAVMERIYGNAYAAVAAASSDNCEQGFLKKEYRIVLPFRTNSDEIHVFGIYPPPCKADTSEEVFYSSWIQRGWTFQERIASTRILMFSRANIHFKCKYFSESMGMERTTKEDYFNIMLDRRTIHSGGTASIYQEWSRLIAQIVHGDNRFTRETDYLPSIAGIALLFSKRLNDDYAAGLWKNSMHQSLCWSVITTRKPMYRNLLQRLKTPSPYIAPSWSWASRREDFSFDLYRSDLSADCRPEFHSLDTAIALRGESVFGEVRDAALIITSKVYMGSPKLTYQPEPRWHLGQDTVRFDGRYFACIKTDCAGQDLFESTVGCTLATPISFLLIGSTIRRYADAEDASARSSDNFETLSEESDAEDASARSSDNFETLSEESDAVSDSQSSSASNMSAESGDDLVTEAIFKRVAYGLLIHPTGNANEYYRVGTFFSKPEFAGGLSFFDDVKVRTIRLV